MSRKKPARPERTDRRDRERAARDLVRDREKLARLERGGAADRPIEVTSSAVIEPRVRSLACPQCSGEYAIGDHRSPAAGLRAVDVACRACGTKRTLWFRIAVSEPN